MTEQLLSLVLLLFVGNYSFELTSVARPQSQCPTIAVECPDAVDMNELVFKARVSGGKLSPEPRYKWKVLGGEIKEGQDTPSVTIVNFNLRKKSVSVFVEIEGLPDGCGNTASCTISVRPPPTSARG